jgi:predicted nucleic acid-binding protein
MARKADKAKARQFVLDASLALAWCFPDEKAEYRQAVLDALAETPAIVPALWHLEVGNALLMGERRKRCTAADIRKWLSFLATLPIAVDDETITRAWNDVLDLAREHTLSVYDASYLELALRRTLPLATLDIPLKKAAQVAGVTAYEP